jgi:hypothetical protein
MDQALREIFAAAKEAKKNGWETFFYQFKTGEREAFEGDIIQEARNRTLGELQCKKDGGDYIEFHII